MTTVSRSRFLYNRLNSDFKQRLAVSSQSLLISPNFFRDADPVVFAIRSGNVETLNDLAASSSHSLLKENNNGWLPLHEAAYSGQIDCLRTLLKGKDILHLNPIFNLFSSSLTLRTALIRGRRS
ncbi:hypothetical protein CHARACLAT_019645 [Characodon lateralis]|uniref:Uncharacterized protein n=1 Tax=Characodon lateralis TaxID=208331 RepID=A0ABU7DU93_9TELE|nr:hypothetical protein [Characodon lateralis]